ncbi:hypothetical protein [Vibrio sp. TRT 29B02]|uniref:hypothetical protein n=1 Tax=Vibrio sp. TRT 29B02 TaxID=3418508 RepID=UPI003CF2F2EF
MVSIRHRYNNGNVILNAKGLAFETSALCQDSLPAKVKDGQLLYKRFGGFFDVDCVMSYVQKVKLVNINGFTKDEDGITGWIEIPPLHYVVGVFMHDRYYVLLRNGIPVSHPLQPASS